MTAGFQGPEVNISFYDVKYLLEMFLAGTNKPSLIEDSPGSDDLATGTVFFFRQKRREMAEGWVNQLGWFPPTVGFSPKGSRVESRGRRNESISPWDDSMGNFNQILARIDDSLYCCNGTRTEELNWNG